MRRQGHPGCTRRMEQSQLSACASAVEPIVDADPRAERRARRAELPRARRGRVERVARSAEVIGAEDAEILVGPVEQVVDAREQLPVAASMLPACRRARRPRSPAPCRPGSALFSLPRAYCELDGEPRSAPTANGPCVQSARSRSVLRGSAGSAVARLHLDLARRRPRSNCWGCSRRTPVRNVASSSL